MVARIEVQWSLPEIAHRFGMRTVDAARMAVTRAVKRLTNNMNAATAFAEATAVRRALA